MGFVGTGKPPKGIRKQFFGIEIGRRLKGILCYGGPLDSGHGELPHILVPGILVCCTNLLESLDHAVLRRFAWKVQFQAPTAEGRQRIYRRYFDTPENPATADCLNRVARIEHLTPGDMRAVWVRFRFRPSADWNHAEIVQALSEEVAYRDQKNVVTGFQCQTQG